MIDPALNLPLISAEAKVIHGEYFRSRNSLAAFGDFQVKVSVMVDEYVTWAGFHYSGDGAVGNIPLQSLPIKDLAGCGGRRHLPRVTKRHWNQARKEHEQQFNRIGFDLQFDVFLFQKPAEPIAALDLIGREGESMVRFFHPHIGVFGAVIDRDLDNDAAAAAGAD